MITTISATPALAPFPVSEFLRPTAKGQSKTAENDTTTSNEEEDGPCLIPIHVALFFDGTNNNLYRDRNGVRVGVPNAKGQSTPIANRPISPESSDHSNVARLFRTFPSDKTGEGIFSFYMPGLGTPFPEINEQTETQEGKAFGKGGQPRIVWALLQVLNTVYGVVNNRDVLYSDQKIGELANDHNAKVGTSPEDTYGERTTITHKSWFAPHVSEVEEKIKKTSKPKIPSLTLSVFGFSRGAAEAAAFCHMFDELLVGDKFAGVPANICFLGVFDTVASIGGSSSVGRTMFLPSIFFDGHWSWANRILKPLPSCVSAGRHFVASQEVRMNFPVTRLRSKHSGFQEVYFPGMHSDVGGGYGPGDFGKGRGSQSSLVSQIPLAHMYKEARAHGVPLTPFSELEQGVKDDYAINQELATAWNAYTAELGSQGNNLMKHMELYYRWRAARLNTLEQTASFEAASPQSRQDMRDANRMLPGDLKALRYRRSPKSNEAGDNPTQIPFSWRDQDQINQWHLRRALNRESLDVWEEWALDIFDKPKPLPPEVMRFFDDYIHDSFAGFYMAGEVTEYDRRVKVSQVVKKNPEDLKGFDRKIYDLAKKTDAAVAKKKAGGKLTAKEKELADEAEYGTPYPIMTDEDTKDMRDPMITTQTSTRREGGGYIIPRGNYPESGIIRRSIYEKELLTKPKISAASDKSTAHEEIFELVWSDDIRADLLQFAARDSGSHEQVEDVRETELA